MGNELWSVVIMLILTGAVLRLGGDLSEESKSPIRISILVWGSVVLGYVLGSLPPLPVHP